MADETKAGTDWQDDELDAIVADYFEMLEDESAGRHYVKSQHRKALIARIGRTHGSVEFKYQNISAVLEILAIPWIRGYKPRHNFQRNALPRAVDRYLTNHPDIFEKLLRVPPEPKSPTGIFVDPPRLTARANETPRPLRRLIRKFDPVERDYRNRSLGKAGEKFVFDLEVRLLAIADRTDLAGKVRWVAAEDGDGAGYDILSFDPSGRERLLEVKTTNGSARTPFFLSRNECALAAERPDAWRIYRVHLFAERPRIFTIDPPLEKVLDLRAEVWRASF